MTKEASTWMPLYVGDYLGGTQRLTTVQHGAYLLLILDYWRNGPPPDDDNVLQQITKLSKAEWKRCRPAVSRLFKITDGEWRHKRIERELELAKENAERRSNKAKTAARARWGGSDNNAASMPQALLEECPPPSPSPKAASAAAREAENEDGHIVVDLAHKLSTIAGCCSPDYAKIIDNQHTVRQWLALNVSAEMLESLIQVKAAKLRTKARSLKYFDGAVRDMLEVTAGQQSAGASLAEQILKRKAAA